MANALRDMIYGNPIGTESTAPQLNLDQPATPWQDIYEWMQQVHPQTFPGKMVWGTAEAIPEVLSQQERALQGQPVDPQKITESMLSLGAPDLAFAEPEANALRTFIGAGARTWNPNLKLAAEMLERSGQSPEEIYRRTMRWRGKDNPWRSEISDAPMQMKVGPASGTRPLSDVIEHPELFQAYSDIANYPVNFTQNMPHGAKGAYSPNVPGLQTPFFDFPAGKYPDRDVLIHEIQHAIQDIEGWPSGSSPGIVLHNPAYHPHVVQEINHMINNPPSYQEFVQGNLGSTQAEYAAFLHALQNATPHNPMGQYLTEMAIDNVYLKDAGEAEARTAMRRHTLGKNQLRRYPPFEYAPPYGTDIPWHELIQVPP